MRRFVRHYGSHPLQLLALLASFALTGYAVRLLVSARPLATVIWFVAAAVGHDLLLLPLYTIADGTLTWAFSRSAHRPPVSPWVNYIRVPALLSGLLFLVFSPSILRLSSIYRPTTDLRSTDYLGRWLLLTAGFFFLSALLLATRIRRLRRGPQAAAAQPADAAGSDGPP